MQNVVVIGLGKIGLMHASIINVIPEAKLACLVDSNAALVGRAKTLIGDDVPFYPSLDDALGHQRLDAAVICAPHFAHASVATQCLNRGLHVLSEKPMANSLDAATRMRDAARQTGRVNAVGFMKLYYPHYQRAQAILNEGAIGRPVSFQATLKLSQVLRPPKGWMYEPPLSGGGVVMTCGCHALALLFRWFGLPRRVTAQGRSHFSARVEDEAHVEMEFASGLRGVFDANWSAPGYPFEQTRIDVEGAEGHMTAHDAGFEIRPRAHEAKFMHRSMFDRAAYDFSPDYGGEGYYNENANFIAACEGRVAPLVTFDDGWAIQRLIDAIYRSIEEGPVTIDG
ncbi:MAG TPA: Gfo/Idh/MocA family oxidoreductase [Elusimicrobiota bacterium]|nr:Gfo/Idh/MocA family oxidoreductase [Elusimicrobiota bacterium]